MDVIDESRKKPRKTKGTPSFKYRNRFAIAVIVTGCALAAGWSCTPFFRVANQKILEAVKPTEEDQDRRYLFSFPVPRTSRQIQEHIDEAEKISVER